MTTLLPISLQNSLYDIMDQSNLRGAAIRAILLSTTEGVPLGRVVVKSPSITCSNDEESSSSTSPMNMDVLASIESVWAPASKQFPVLGLDKLKQVTAIYDHGTLIHIYQAPMVSSPERHRSKRRHLDFTNNVIINISWILLFTLGHYNHLWSAFQYWCRSIDSDSVIKTCLRPDVAGVGQFSATGYEQQFHTCSFILWIGSTCNTGCR